MVNWHQPYRLFSFIDYTDCAGHSYRTVATVAGILAVSVPIGHSSVPIGHSNCIGQDYRIGHFDRTVSVTCVALIVNTISYVDYINRIPVTPAAPVTPPIVPVTLTVLVTLTLSVAPTVPVIPS